ncbi:spore germination protein [Paenibacillus glycanilyticus]|uniref:Spore germination protein n=1 Tax=Paenibacillus glycanilyticus TaxID=126569 RepID=A0ABQ6GCJ2_9BACL|nr:spore germination protein [Paenibacillus glycanilyticus]GLX67016.1 hypothetical protein MU1_13600 [Paenibacillus glycanilyticus]
MSGIELEDEKMSQPLQPYAKSCRFVLEEKFGHTTDFCLEEISQSGCLGIICYLKTMVDLDAIQEIAAMLQVDGKGRQFGPLEEEAARAYGSRIFTTMSLQYPATLREVMDHILNGYMVICWDGLHEAIAVPVQGGEQRAVSEPTTQTVVKGPKDSFTESIVTNMSLVRRRIKSEHLRFESMTLGVDTRTSIELLYIEGITNIRIVNEVRERLGRIQTSSILDSGSIEEFITDSNLTPFPLLLSTERPDSIAGGLLEGRTAILVDGTPFALLAPVSIHDFFQTPEDYYLHFYIATFIRWIRYVAFLIALLLPALFVSVMTYHHELIPTNLLINLMAQREGVPFPTVVEAFLMELTFEVLREAGIRMPRAIGQTVSIVGALVIGQAAVEAGIVSNAMVIIVSLTGICNYVSPSYSFASSARLLRFLLIILASVLGLYGTLLGVVIIVAHLTGLRSIGVPYLSSTAPWIMEDQDDVFIRLPMFLNRKRPRLLMPQQVTKQSWPSKLLGRKGGGSN